MIAADVLAGPILRRVETDLVSVWIALTIKATVQVEIYSGIGEAGSLGAPIAAKALDPVHNKHDGKTLDVGKGLHFALAVWEPAAVAGLQWGGLYSYDIKITPDGGGGAVGLKDLGLLTDTPITVGTVQHPHLALGYQANWLPSFALPPADLRDLKMIQGSCRGTNGHGRDAMAPVDDLLRTLITDAKARPHQMHLTGDQIYADEGAPELVEIINKATIQWLGGPDAKSAVETLHIEFGKTNTDPADAFDVPVDILHLPPSKRGHLMIDVGHFTSDHTDSHAMSFGEYCGTYLTGWCNVAWGDWNAKTRLASAKTRYKAYLDTVKKLDDAVTRTDFSKINPVGISDDDDKKNTIREMIRFYAAQELPPPEYRVIDSFLSQADLAAAWGKGDTDDSIRYDFWTNWTAAFGITPPLPVDPAQPPAPPADIGAARMNRLARALTPSWYTGHEMFAPAYDSPAFEFRGSEEFNRIHRLEWGYQDLPKVRRVLANIPTYMIFDDHEVTDDWNITYLWQKQTRGNSLARGVLRNALAAFTVCEYWGNDPRACRNDSIPSQALDHIEALFANASETAPGPAASAVAALETAFDLTLLPDTPKTPTDPATRMRWDFRYDGPSFEVLALDSRTWRGAEIDANGLLKEPFFPDASATLMTDEAVRLQIPDQPGAGINPNGVCFVIAAAPFLGFPAVESVVQPLINLKDMLERDPKFPFKRWKRSLTFGRVAHDPEPWGFRPELFEAILARLNSRQRVIFYSGDVHYSFASHMNYWQLDPSTGKSKQATRFIQLTASSLRAQQPTVASVFALDLLQQVGALAAKTSRQGWHRGAANSGTFQPPIKPGAIGFNQHVTQSLLDDPVLVSPDGLPKGVQYVRKPDWVWQMALDADARPDTVRFATSPPPNFSTASHLEMVQSVARRHAWQARYAMARSWFWWTNFTFVSFQPDSAGNPASVVFQVYSYDPDGHEPAAQPFLTTLIDMTVKPQPDPGLVEVA